MRTEPPQRYEIRFQPRRTASDSGRLPELLPLRHCASTLAVNLRWVGKPLFGPLTGCDGARRGTYRIVYQIDENSRVVHVLDIDHRSEIYRRSQR